LSEQHRFGIDPYFGVDLFGAESACKFDHLGFPLYRRALLAPSLKSPTWEIFVDLVHVEPIALKTRLQPIAATKPPARG